MPMKMGHTIDLELPRYRHKKVIDVLKESVITDIAEFAFLGGAMATLAGSGNVPVIGCMFGGLSFVLAKYLLPWKSDNEDLGCILENKPSQEFFLDLGLLVHQHTKFGAAFDAKKQGNVIAPLLHPEEIGRTHYNIIGTTGSGKTVFAKSVMRQLLRDIGTGYMFIEGKGDNGMGHEVAAEVALAGRFIDYRILNFLDKHNSNSINILEDGDYESIRDVLVDFMIAGDAAKSDTWLQGGKDLLTNTLKTILTLRDADLMFDVSQSDMINTIEDMKLYHKKISLLSLRSLLISPKALIHFCLALDRVHQNSYKELIATLKTYKLKENEELIISDYDKIEIHEGLKDVIIQQSNGLGDWSKVQQLKTYENIVKSIKSNQGVFYKLEVSKGFYGEMFTTFFENYSEIFAVEYGDIDLEDIIVGGKILHCVLQGINPSQANSLGKLLLSMIRMFAKKRAKEKPLKVPYMVFCDEFNSWSKGITGFADLMSVTRGYGISFALMYQSNLNKIDDGKGIEADQILANTNTIILLKTQDDKIVKQINEKLRRQEVAIRDELKEHEGRKEDGTEQEKRYDNKERDRIEFEDVTNLKSGQGYIITSGLIGKMITSYIVDKTTFEQDVDTNLPVIDMYPKSKNKAA